MSTPESRVKSKVKELLAKYTIYGNWPVPGGYGTPMLDFVGCYRGWFFAIETKAEGEVLTPRQEFVAEQIREAEGLVFIVTGLNHERDPDSWQGWTSLANWLDAVEDGEYSGEGWPCL